jgi:hypothetical protein
VVGKVQRETDTLLLQPTFAYLELDICVEHGEDMELDCVELEGA